jgi:hypothetical protein
MTTLGVTFPSADDSVKHAVTQMNSAFELVRKTACSPSGGAKEFHQVMLHGFDTARENLKKTTERPDPPPPCDQMKLVEKSFANYKGPAIPFFDEWKVLFVSMESDVMGLVCVNNKVEPEKALDNFERITRSSFKSFCGSDEVLTPMSPEEGLMVVEKMNDKRSAASDASALAAVEVEEVAKASGVDVDGAKADINETLGSISCPSGFGVLTTHYEIILAVLFAGFLLGVFISRRR